MDLTVEGSTWGRAGRLFRRINFVFFAGGSASEFSSLVVVKAVLAPVAVSVSGDADRFREGEAGAKVVRAWTTSAMVL